MLKVFIRLDAFISCTVWAIVEKETYRSIWIRATKMMAFWFDLSVRISVNSTIAALMSHDVSALLHWIDEICLKRKKLPTSKLSGYWTYVPGGYFCPIRISQGINTTYSSALSYNSTTFFRTSDNTSIFYYKAILLTVNISGTYNLFSDSTFDSYGYLYANYFNFTETGLNLLRADDDCAGNQQFLIAYRLVQNTTYILVFTTYDANITGSFSVVAYGSPGVSLSW